MVTYQERMNEEMLPGKILEWCMPGRRRRRKGRPRNSWMQEVTTGLRKKGINSIERNEWKGMKKKNKNLMHRKM